jgi:hypothetical protein
VSDIVPLDHSSWSASPDPLTTERAVEVLEAGSVLFFPLLRFPIEVDEVAMFSPDILAASKNSSFDPASGRVTGTTLSGADLERLGGMMRRFSDASARLVDQILPAYRGRIARARSSFRPAEIAGRQTTWRKDDTRLHVDSFPASPVQGRRILRLFTNVNPAGKPRVWRIGGDFEAVARRFVDHLSVPLPGTGTILRALRITKSYRSAYDALMLQLHDHMKKDAEFQQTSPQITFEFRAATTWLAFTDQVSHAAMAGQYQFEQTFYVPVDAMIDQRRSPLRILERIKGRKLA